MNKKITKSIILAKLKARLKKANKNLKLYNHSDNRDLVFYFRGLKAGIQSAIRDVQNSRG